MKRFLLTSLLMTMVFSFAAFQCSSTEIVSAKLYIKQGHTEKAIEALEREIEKNPKSDEAHYLLGSLYGDQKEVDKMLLNFDKSLSISDKFVSEINNQKLYHWGKNFNAGVGYFNKANQASTEDSSKHFMDICINSFQNAIKIQPDSTDSYQNLVFAYINSGRQDDAIKPLQDLINIEGGASSYAMLGEIYLTKGQVLRADSAAAYQWNNKALTLLEKGRKEHPTNRDILLLLSNSYIATDKVTEALSAFKDGVASEPENKYYRYNYGVLLLEDKNYEEAEIQFKKAIEIDPEYVNAIYNLGVTYFRWGVMMRQADEDKIAAGEAEILGEAYKEKLNLALPHLEKYLEISPGEANLWELMGRIYANLGMNEQSENAFKKADELR